jgi:hypothetical protein
VPFRSVVRLTGEERLCGAESAYLVFVEFRGPGEASHSRETALATWAVERWADFPVDEDPRPLVFTGPIAFPDDGFTTGRAKAAFLRGDIEVQGPGHDSVLTILRHPGSTEQHPGSNPGPLILTNGRKAETSFSTDRGKRVLPAWRFEGTELLGALWVVDPEVAVHQWKPMEPPEHPAPTRGRSHRSHRSRIEADDHTLHVEFTGATPDWVDYPRSEVIESDHAVAVTPVGIDHGPPGPRLTVGYRREVVVALRSRLGNRVLVNLDARPVVVET